MFIFMKHREEKEEEEEALTDVNEAEAVDSNLF